MFPRSPKLNTVDGGSTDSIVLSYDSVQSGVGSYCQDLSRSQLVVALFPSNISLFGFAVLGISFGVPQEQVVGPNARGIVTFAQNKLARFQFRSMGQHIRNSVGSFITAFYTHYSVAIWVKGGCPYPTLPFRAAARFVHIFPEPSSQILLLTLSSAWYRAEPPNPIRPSQKRNTTDFTGSWYISRSHAVRTSIANGLVRATGRFRALLGPLYYNTIDSITML